MSKKTSIIFESESESSEDHQTTKTLPTLYAIDSNGKRRVWKCWVIGDTVYREYGLVDGKHVSSERTFDGKNKKNKNATTPEEQAWNEANKEWVAHIDKEYVPDKTDKEGLSMMRKLLKEKEKTGGHNINSVATTTSAKTNTNDTTKTIAKAVKNISRKKVDTCMVDEIEGGPVIPMKAETWELADESDPHSVLPKVSKYFMMLEGGKGKNAKYEDANFFSQPKLDGVRCRVMIQEGKMGVMEIVMTSNSGKQFPWFSSLRKAFLDWFSKVKGYGLSYLLNGLDGELYAQEFREEDGKLIDSLIRFSTIAGICALSRSKPHPLEDQIQFHCFDIIDKSCTIPQNERFNKLEKLFKALPVHLEKKIVKVDTQILGSVKEVPDEHNKYADEGYEGIILRSFYMKYKVGKRSAEMRKFKYFKDEEYEIVGCKVDKGVSKEHFVWILKNENGKEFSAKPIGTKEQKLDWYEHKNKYVGKFLTVKFQEFTDDTNNIPRFPIAKHFRTGKGTD